MYQQNQVFSWVFRRMIVIHISWPERQTVGSCRLILSFSQPESPWLEFRLLLHVLVLRSLLLRRPAYHLQRYPMRRLKVHLLLLLLLALDLLCRNRFVLNCPLSDSRSLPIARLLVLHLPTFHLLAHLPNRAWVARRLKALVAAHRSLVLVLVRYKKYCSGTFHHS